MNVRLKKRKNRFWQNLKNISEEKSVDGFVFVDKPEGISSFVLAARVRRIFGEKKSGHTGTLDPMATGVMVIALSGATRFIELLPDKDKAYKADFLLGTRTDTLDISGSVLSKSKVNVSKAEVEKVLRGFVGETQQLPPMYSALKKDGVRLYELARRGESVEREKRKITISELTLLSYDESSFSGELCADCSAGTYIRSLISDIGEALSCGAVMTALRRTRANGVPIEKCRTLSQLEKLRESGRLSEAVTPVEDFLPFEHLPVTEKQAKRFSNGGGLSLERLRKLCPGKLYCVLSPQGEFLGVGLADEEKGILAPRKIMSKNS